MGLPASASPAEIAEARRLSELALDHWIEQEIRLQRISQQLRVAGRELCGSEVSPVLGLTVSGSQAVPGSLREMAELRFGDERMRVVSLFPGMAAETAGVRLGDVLLSVGGASVKSELAAYRPPAGREGSLTLRLARDGQELELSVPDVQGCAFPSQLGIYELVNAFAESRTRRTFFTNALLRAIESDSQLAIVVGHELAHIIIELVDGTSLGGPQEEARADYIGAYLTARAGFPLDEGDVRVFDALSLGDLNAIERGSRTHPISPARTFALRETLTEIEGKRSSGAPLLPGPRSPLTR